MDILVGVTPVALKELDGYLGHFSEQVSEKIHARVNVLAKNVMNTSNISKRYEALSQVIFGQTLQLTIS